MEYIRDFNFVSLLLRFLCAFLCGAIIGFEREKKGKFAGLKTHVLICVAAAMTTATSQYMVVVLKQYTDIARFGAGVASGLGFLGAGTIILTQKRRVRGLTTAAGIWACGIIGLCAGAGFFEGAIITTILIVFNATVVSKLEKKEFDQDEVVAISAVVKDKTDVKELFTYFRDVDCEIESVEYGEDRLDGFCEVIFRMKLQRKIKLSDVLIDLKEYEFLVNVNAKEKGLE